MTYSATLLFRLTESGGLIDVKLTVADGRRFGGRSQVLDRKDGSYIVNYRPSLPMNDVNIHLSLGGKTLGDSPYKLDGELMNNWQILGAPQIYELNSFIC